MDPTRQIPRIAFIQPALASMSPSGVTTFVRQMADGFAKYGDQFRIVEVPHGEYERKKSAERNVVPVSSPAAGGKSAAIPAATTMLICLGYLKNLLIDLRRVWAVRARCRNRLLLTNDFGCETLPIALRIAFPFSRIVAISHTHPGRGIEATHWVRRLVERLCYWSLNDILYNSDSSRQEWARKLGIPVSKGRVIHLGTGSPDLEVPADYPARPAGVVDFLCVARFVDWKGQGNLVRVWQEVVKNGDRNSRLILIGDGPCYDSVRQEAEQAGLGERVVFMGARTGADRYFNRADVAILLSTEPEAFGLTLLEAMSRGKPVMASRLGGIREIVEDGVTGVLASPGDLKNATEAVALLAASPELRTRMGGNGRKRWKDLFSADHMIRRYVEYLQNILIES